MFIWKVWSLTKTDSVVKLPLPFIVKDWSSAKKKHALSQLLNLKQILLKNLQQTRALPFIVMAWSLTKTDSITDFVTAVYGKALNYIKMDSVKDPVTAIYIIGLKLSVTYFITGISSKDLKLYQKQTQSKTLWLTFLVEAWSFTKNSLQHRLCHCH